MTFAICCMACRWPSHGRRLLRGTRPKVHYKDIVRTSRLAPQSYKSSEHGWRYISLKPTILKFYNAVETGVQLEPS